ncbi:MAG TPA: FAD-binding oxidoreductase, partial [Planctomycetota bacterium]|nr:FAD-binding oxidoreductase [Planctomycetota bacterium]
GRGSTRRSSAVIRCHYGEREAIKLAHEGRATWEAWAEHLRLRKTRARFVRSGVLFLLKEASARPSGSALGLKPEASGADLHRIVRGLRALGVGCDLLRGRALREAFPFFAFTGPAEVGLVEPDSGYVAGPREAVLDTVEAAAAAGVRFRFGERLLAVDTTDGDPPRILGVRTTRGRFPAEALVNAAGPWSVEVNLLARCPLPLATVPLGQTVVEVALAGPPEPRLPAMIDLRQGFYLRPSPSGVRLGGALPRDHRDFRSKPDERTDPRALRAFAREKVEALRGRWPAARVRGIRPKPALYDWTAADGYPLIDRTDVEGYFVAIGTSGAWFKGAPAIGRIVAELVEDPGTRRVRLPRTGHLVELPALSRRRAPIG